MGNGGQHPAFHYAVLASVAGGAGYVGKRSTASLVGGLALGVGFLGAGLLVLTDAISDHAFAHGTGVVMSTVVAGVMGRRAALAGLPLRAPLLLAGAGALSAGYHAHQLAHPPSRRRYEPGRHAPIPDHLRQAASE